LCEIEVRRSTHVERRRGQLTTLPLEDGRPRTITAAVRSGARSWLTKTTALVAWDAIAAIVLFAATAPLARIPLFDERWQAAGVGARGAPALVFAALAPVIIALAGGYGRGQNPLGLGRFTRLAVAAVATSWALWPIGAIAGWALDVGQLTVVTVAAPFAWLAGRQVADKARRRAPERVLILGSGAVARQVADLVARHPERGIAVVGCVDDQGSWIDGIDPPRLGGLDDLSEVVRAHQIHRVVVAFSASPDERVVQALRACDAAGVEIDVVPRLFELVGPAPAGDNLGGMGLLTVHGRRPGRVARAAKRTLDIVVSATALLVFSPVMLAVAVAIRLEDGKPVFFRQTRIGRGGRPFRIVKFRTMMQGAEARQAGELIAAGPEAISELAEAMKYSSDAWITRVGSFLRRTSVDELPQLWNVLKGDMSLVGPRPLRGYEVEALTDWQNTRQEVRPGITGLWQILGRSEIAWNERMQLDYTYVRHWSFQRDLAILARTAGVVLSRRGAV
jgi:exopolysaccharide biosynthesis polyprenyl glycosylphosphotransferase